MTKQQSITILDGQTLYVDASVDVARMFIDNQGDLTLVNTLNEKLRFNVPAEIYIGDHHFRAHSQGIMNVDHEDYEIQIGTRVARRV